MNVCLFGASSDRVAGAYKEAVEALGFAMAKQGHTLLFGGGASGMMGAAARGVFAGGGKIIGVSPSFFNVDGILFPDCEMIYTDTMHERKVILREKADAFVITPGGVGTYDEFFEVLTLRQLGLHRKPIVLFNIEGCFEPLLRLLDESIAGGFMKENCRELYTVCTEVDAVLDAVERPADAGPEDIGSYKFLRYGDPK